MTSKQLQPGAVHAVGVAALENALDLMSDALVLRAAGRTRRAYALGVVAVEELAKSLTCRSLLQSWSGISVVELKLALRPQGDAHAQRYAEALEYVDALGLGRLRSLLPTANMVEVAKSDMRARERVLYVDLTDSGDPMTPAGVAEAEAELWVSGIAGLFSQLARAWRDGLDEALGNCV
jgi:AbiV family abortive infection protein